MGAKRIAGSFIGVVAAFALAPAIASAETGYFIGPDPKADEGAYFLIVKDGEVRRSFYIFDARCKSELGGPRYDGGIWGEFPRAKVRRDGRFSVLRHRRGGLIQFAGRVGDDGIDGRFRGRSSKRPNPFEEIQTRCDTGPVDIHLDKVSRDEWREYNGRDELGPGAGENYVCLTVMTSPSCMT